MTNQQKVPPKHILRRASGNKTTKQDVKIIKHFHPVKIRHTNSDDILPEIDSDFDISTYSHSQKRNKNPIKNSTANAKDINSTHSEKNIKVKILATHQTTSKTDKKFVNKCDVQDSRIASRSFKSKSYVDSSSTPRTSKLQNCKQLLPLQSKSFTTTSSTIERKTNVQRLSRTINRKISHVSSNCTEVESPYVNNLKKEILLNKNNSSESWLEKKVNLLSNSKSRAENLREEICTLLNVKSFDKKKYLTELKTEIAYFRRNEDLCIYNVSNEINIAKNEKSSTNSNSDENLDSHNQTAVRSFVDDILEEASTTAAIRLKKLEINECGCEESIFREDNRIATIQGILSGEKTSPVLESHVSENGLQVLDKPEPDQLYCYQGAQKDYIHTKIYEANLLIDRVKGTLLDIKNKTKPSLSEEIPTAEIIDKAVNLVEDISNSTFVCEDDNEHITIDSETRNRPKTRRPEDVRDIEKFKNTPEDELSNDSYDTTSLECLQTKLNTINEQTESDLSSTLSENKVVDNESKGSMTSVSCHFIRLQDSIEIQVKPEVTSLGIQHSCNSIDNATQTVAEQRTLTAENTTNNEIIPVPVKLEKSNRLIVQVLPTINITSGLVVQPVHNFFIDSVGKTHFVSKTDTTNISFIEMRRDSKESRIKFDSEPQLISKNEENGNARGSIESCSTVEQIKALNERMKEKEDTSHKIHAVSSAVSSHSHKEMFYKSFQLYDNPNRHDPGEFPSPCMDDSFYKTYINPKGLPSTVVCKFPYRRGVDSEKLKQISSASKKYGAVSDSKCGMNSLSAQKETSSKLWDIGLYSSKEVQCDMNPLVKANKENQQVLKDSSSYEKVSFTLSYSTEETITSDTSDPNEHKKCNLLPDKVEDQPQSVGLDFNFFERDSGVMTPTLSGITEKISVQNINDKFPKQIDDLSHTNNLNPNDNENSSLLSEKNKDKSQSVDPKVDLVETNSRQITPPLGEPNAPSERKSTLKYLRNKFSKEIHDLNQAKRLHLNNLYNSDVSSLSTDSTAAQLITRLTKTSLTKDSVDEVNKIPPRVRRLLSKDKESHKNDFNVLSFQTHGDYISNDGLKNPHLKLGVNGRYKDEENLFCDNYYSSFENSSLRRKVLRNLSRHNYVKKYTLDSSKSDTVSIEGPLSEGEIKCQCSTSLGEIHLCKHRKPHLKRHPDLSYNNSDVDSNVGIRERRTYFDNWITYYINKNKTFFNDSSSSSGSK